ncbi:dGTPase [Enterobacteriaceae bacterium H16N7]|nr:dGTPase [Dryocola clanedunensis]
MNPLFSTNRHRPSTAKHSSLLAATQSDRARLIYSAAFRRLQQKAQVFSLESNSAVRSRLTHSIEVSHIGRYIVASICDQISKDVNIPIDDKIFWEKESLAIANMVEISCLAHDIGNPPFGHFGEAAIKEWSSSNEICIALKKSLNEKEIIDDNSLLDDFKNFDGNPQGFRILTKLQGEDGLNGLNLTYGQLASFLKYTFCPEDMRANAHSNKPFNKKIGFFNTEREVLKKAWQCLEMSENTRHPLSFLMEASDDISYCISDIEDGIEKKIIDVCEFSSFVSNNIKKIKEKHPEFEYKSDELIGLLENKEKIYPISNFLAFKTTLSNFLVERVADVFVTKYQDFMSRNVINVIIAKGSFEYSLLDILKQYTSTYLFTSAEAEKMELSGFAIIKGILDEYLKLLCLPKKEFLYLVTKDNSKINDNNLHIERRLFNRLPEKHLNSYKTEIAGISIKDENWSDEKFITTMSSIDIEKEWNLRVHLIVDFVSGMTDQFSMEMYQMLKGIKIK